MSGGVFCHCGEFHNAGSSSAKAKHREQFWRVLQRNCHHSAFAGYHRTYSDYSSVICMKCGGAWRTRAKYVDDLPNATEEEVWKGYEHEEKEEG